MSACASLTSSVTGGTTSVSSVRLSVTVALLPAASVTVALTERTVVQSTQVLVSDHPAALAIARVAAVTAVSPSVIATATPEASASIPDSDRLTSVDSVRLVTSSEAATVTAKFVSASAVVSKSKLSQRSRCYRRRLSCRQLPIHFRL